MAAVTIVNRRREVKMDLLTVERRYKNEKLKRKLREAGRA